MTFSLSHAAAPTVQDMGRPTTAAEAAWMHAFFNGRVAVLGLGFALLPLALALAPQVVNGAVSVILAGLLSATLGLVGLRFGSWQVAVAGMAAGLACLGFGPLLGGLAGATSGLALVALALEAAALPHMGRTARGAFAALGATALLVVTVTLASGEVHAPSVQAGVAALVLPLASGVTLVQVMRASRLALSARTALDLTRTRRDAIMAAAADVAIAVVDRGAHVIDSSEAAARLLGGGCAELAGRGLIDRVLIAERPAFLKAVSDAAVLSRETRLALHVCGPQTGAPSAPPRFSPVEAIIRPVGDASGEVSLRFEPGVDARPAAECRAALFANLSHDVRTPMNAILGFSEILANPSLQPRSATQVAEYAGLIHKSGLNAFAVTRAVVDLLRVESADFRLDPESVDLAELARKCVAGIAEKADCRFETEVSPCEVVADVRCLRMAITNLVEGFVHAGPADPVLVRLERRAGALNLAITCVSDAPQGRLGHAAHLGVVDALLRRIAALTGYSFTLTIGERALSATLALPVASNVTPLRPALPEADASLVHSLRKIA